MHPDTPHVARASLPQVALVAIGIACLVLGAALATPVASVRAAPEAVGHIVVLKGSEDATGAFQVAGNDAVSLAAARQVVAAAGATIHADLADQIGIIVVSATPEVAAAIRASSLVELVARDFTWKAFSSMDEALASGELTVVEATSPGGGAEPSADPMEALQWDMIQIRAPQSHELQSGARTVDVGILDSGVDGHHPDFVVDGVGSNVDCRRGRNSVFFLPSGPGVGTPDPCIDNQFHGTHVAGTVAAQANGIGIVGVAPNVTLVPVKVCDASGYCYASGVVDGITYAGDIRLDVINMSFFVDDDEFQESTEFKCQSDETQRAFTTAVERALRYAVKRGVAPVAALGNSDQDLAAPVDDAGNPYPSDCRVVPSESSGVIGTVALGNRSEKAGYSNYGHGLADVSAPGGNGTTGDCRTTILSTLPGGAYGCIQGTSMASPHAAGVAALIVSQFGRLSGNGDVRLAPARVAELLQGTAVDIGLAGYDECFGHGRIDALRAVVGDTSVMADPSAPHCPEYTD